LKSLRVFFVIESALYRIEIDFQSHIDFDLCSLPGSTVSSRASRVIRYSPVQTDAMVFPKFKNVDFN